MKTNEQQKIAYFSMEIALENDLKTYAGGLGVLAGDILRSASKNNFPMIGITLFNRNGYFKQSISEKGKQIEGADKSNLKKLELLPIKFYLPIGTDKVLVKVWRYFLKQDEGIEIPIYLLDTNNPENREKHRRLTENLYPGDLRKKLKQSILLGRGGVKLLKKIGLDRISKIHLNEGHGALAAIELLLNDKHKSLTDKIRAVRKKIIFTTHTPIPAGHDVYFGEFLLKYQPDFPIKMSELVINDTINFSKLALFFSSYSNAVSLKHRLVSKKMFPEYKIDTVTNGVNSLLWTSSSFSRVYDKYLLDWRHNYRNLKKAKNIPLEEIKEAHLLAKEKLFRYIKEKKNIDFSLDTFTIVFARRFAPYKRPTLLLDDLERLKKINKTIGRLQIIYAGKAHPDDEVGRTLVSEVNKRLKKISHDIKVVFLENYDLSLAKLLVSGADIWLNNPALPNEASATSGMKAACNGVLHVSSFDGWWPEGYIKNKTGWVIKDADSLYEKLEKEIIPLYYNHSNTWLKMMRSVISLNASYFNTDRVLEDYIKKAYR